MVPGMEYTVFMVIDIVTVMVIYSMYSMVAKVVSYGDVSMVLWLCVVRLVQYSDRK